MVWALVLTSGAGISKGETNARDELARHAFQFAHGQLARVTADAAFGTAKGHVDQRRFPRHERGQ
jgi:hypothetical protein